ncbi:MAG: hypothetical protein JW917_09615 [Ignavibacteria bacterium]|nr:hypothetical protein [Ignavibacteria bacterium]
MKYTTIVIIIVFTAVFLGSCTSSRNGTQPVQCKWNYLEYSLTSAPLAPPNYLHYTVYIESKSKKNHIEYIINYKDSNEKKIKYDFVIETDEMEKLNKLIISSDILDAEIPSLPENEIPDGSPLRSVKINLYKDGTQTNKVTPYFPVKQHNERLISLYDFIESVVPKNIWENINKEKEEYIRNYKNSEL